VALQTITLDGPAWVDAPTDWRAPFLPTAAGAWSTFPKLDDFFACNRLGVMSGGTWVIAPDADALRRRWDRLLSESNPAKKETLFHPHIRGESRATSMFTRPLAEGLAGHAYRSGAVATETGPAIEPVRYVFRSL
jgi:hypothetical protein